MKASELRLGVNVFYRGQIILIDDCESIGDCDQYPNHYNGIPLTEEWLLKMDMPEDGSTRDLFGNYDVWFERDGCSLCLKTETSSRKIEFVHTAQNLYYDLKGEELIFTASQSKQL